jgi:Maintenance of mitochondrial structure and function
VAEVFPEQELVGWYIVSGSSGLGQLEKTLHRQVAGGLIESPLLLHLNDAAVLSENQRSVPLAVYQAEERGTSTGTSSVSSAASSSSLDLQPLPFKVEASEVERLTIDTVTTSTTTAASGAASSSKDSKDALLATDPMAAHWSSQLTALAMLKERLSVLETYLLEVKQGNLPMDRSVLRAISNTVGGVVPTNPEALLSASSGGTSSGSSGGSNLQRDMAVEASDSLALSLLSTVAKGAETAASLAFKLTAADLGSSSVAAVKGNKAGGGEGHLSALVGIGMGGAKERKQQRGGGGARPRGGPSGSRSISSEDEQGEGEGGIDGLMMEEEYEEQQQRQQQQDNDGKRMQEDDHDDLQGRAGKVAAAAKARLGTTTTGSGVGVGERRKQRDWEGQGAAGSSSKYDDEDDEEEARGGGLGGPRKVAK